MLTGETLPSPVSSIFNRPSRWPGTPTENLHRRVHYDIFCFYNIFWTATCSLFHALQKNSSMTLFCSAPRLRNLLLSCCFPSGLPACMTTWNHHNILPLTSTSIRSPQVRVYNILICFFFFLKSRVVREHPVKTQRRMAELMWGCSCTALGFSLIGIIRSMCTFGTYARLIRVAL